MGTSKVSSPASMPGRWPQPVLSTTRQRRSSRLFPGESLNFEIDTCNLTAALGMVIPGALAKLRETDMAVLAEFDAGGNKNTVDVDAGLALKFEQQIDHPGVRSAATEHPSTAAENCTGKSAHQARWFNHRHGLHLQGPRYCSRPGGMTLQHFEPHPGYIGSSTSNIRAVLESNAS